MQCYVELSVFRPFRFVLLGRHSFSCLCQQPQELFFAPTILLVLSLTDGAIKILMARGQSAPVQGWQISKYKH
jgi:hypothetical protein